MTEGIRVMRPIWLNGRRQWVVEWKDGNRRWFEPHIQKQIDEMRGGGAA